MSSDNVITEHKIYIPSDRVIMVQQQHITDCIMLDQVDVNIIIENTVTGVYLNQNDVYFIYS